MKIQFVAATTFLVSTSYASTLPRRETSSTDTTSLTFFNGTCTAEKITIRKEWRNLSDAEKKAYTNAELCLMELPAQTSLSGVTSRFSDLQGLHRSLTNTSVGDIIHNVGQFLPWHRMFMHTHETLLREHCNYTGPMSWWDEKLDADSGNFFQSNMWTDSGIGSNGTGTASCVTNGPFANTIEHIGPLLENTDYCLGRAWDNSLIQYSNSAAVEACTQHNDYYSFFNCMVAYPDGPHVAGHTAVGMLMADIDSSPGDPAFFLHHNYVDRIWWQWQQANASFRMYDMSGNSVNLSLPLNIENTPASGWPNTTLDYTLNVADILPSVSIQTVMNVQGGYLCYKYDY
ncbi:tyrosinase central protein-like protein [Coleophoma cylindrospora]|uniref:Tyrosinase central protein-like protein n=1 Tax=Coleophoma cylindrospora TaxID=1849047 RepID=A0A3D8R5C5_9HELO|nr:tyrosinase central protein-like protein [Coleophoma cylindrospora]